MLRREGKLCNTVGSTAYDFWLAGREPAYGKRHRRESEEGGWGSRGGDLNPPCSRVRGQKSSGGRRLWGFFTMICSFWISIEVNPPRECR